MMQGSIEFINRSTVRGWVCDEDNLDEALRLLVYVDSRPAFRIIADLYRQDLEAAGFGNGCHGYEFPLDGLSLVEQHEIYIRHEGTGEAIPGCPILMQPVKALDEPTREFLAQSLADTDDDGELEQRARFLAEQADRLLERRTERSRSLASLAFRLRWNGEQSASTLNPVPRVLLVGERLPDPDRNAGSAAVLSHMRSLQRLGYQVSVAAAAMPSSAATQALEASGLSCFCLPWVASVEEALKREEGQFEIVYLYGSRAVRYMPLIRHYQPRACIVYSVADLEHLRFQRQAEAENRTDLAELSQQVRAIELAAARAADCVITHSDVERSLLLQALPELRVVAMPWSVACQPVTVPFAQRQGIAFVGNFEQDSNLDAAWWLAREVMPLVRARNASIECKLGGSGMPAALRAADGPGLQTLGFIEAPTSIFDTVRLTVAPIRFAAGIQGKVLHSMATGLPCACTRMAADGLELPPVFDAIIGSDAGALATIICDLHSDEGLNKTYVDAGFAYVADRLSNARIDSLMREVIRS